jgi:hypothetical protein
MLDLPGLTRPNMPVGHLMLNDRFWRKADIGLIGVEGQLLTQSGHSRWASVRRNTMGNSRT